MNIEGKTLWQVAAGDGKMNYFVDVCLRDDVVVIGPGRFGAWPDCEQELRQKDSVIRAGIVKRFAETMKRGDIIVLRVGTQKVFGVGIVVSDYNFSERYAKVGHGPWDLQHYRRVRWLWHRDGEPKTFPVYSLKLGSSVQYVIPEQVHLRQWLEGLDIPESAYERPLQVF